jgi:hypothetical protein
MSRNNQLLSGVQVKNLVFSGSLPNVSSTAIQINTASGPFGGVTFLVNFAATTTLSTIRIQESPDGSTNWTDVTVGYQVSTIQGLPITAAPASTGAAISASTTTTAANQFLAISINHPGKDTGVQTSNITAFVSKPWLKVLVSAGTPAFGVALLHNSVLTPVPQPDVIIETKGTN